MIAEILDDAAYSPGGNSEPLGNNFLSIKGGLGKDVVLGGIWDVVSVPHELWCRGGKGGQNNG